MSTSQPIEIITLLNIHPIWTKFCPHFKIAPIFHHIRQILIVSQTPSKTPDLKDRQIWFLGKIFSHFQ